MNDRIASIVPSMAVLGPAGAVALFLTLNRDWARDDQACIRGAVRIAVLGVVFQAIHFTEEALTGLHARLPALFGLPPMPFQFFVLFNLTWLVIWSLSTWGLAARCRAALFPLWFLGIGCAVNGLAHALLAIAVGEYFPGLVTAPVVGVTGVFLLRRLLAVTRAVHAAPRTA